VRQLGGGLQPDAAMLNVLLHLGHVPWRISLLSWDEKKSGCMQIHSLNQKDMIFVGTALATEAMVSSTRFGFKKVF